MVENDAASGNVRLDAWIWSVRLAKTRSQAADACKGGHVRVNGDKVKPAQAVKIGDQVRVRRSDGWERTVTVTKLISKRVGPPAAAECYTDESPPPRRASSPGRPRCASAEPDARPNASGARWTGCATAEAAERRSPPAVDNRPRAARAPGPGRLTSWA